MRAELQQFKTHDVTPAAVPAHLSGTTDHGLTWLSHTSQSTALVQALRQQQIQVSTSQIISLLPTVRYINVQV